MKVDSIRRAMPSALRQVWVQEPAAADRLAKEGLRPVGALVAIAAGLPAMVALIAAAADPGRSLVPIALATGLAAIVAGAALIIRLREARDEARRLAAALEAVQDSSWQMHDRTAANPAIAATDMADRPMALPIATVSHEMRAPLHGVLGLIDLLLETPLTLEQQGYGRAIHASTSVLARLVDDLIDYSRIEAGRFLLEAAPVIIEPVIESIAELMAPRAHAKGIGLAARVDPDLPIVEIDEMRLRQVLINLVGNAIDFTDQGAVVLGVETGSRLTGGSIPLVFTVSDSGPGIAPEDRERIFMDFERASKLRGGVGLGLAISQRIVNRMGGVITVEERMGGGSIFRLELVLPKRGKPSARRAAGLSGRNLLLIAEATLEFKALAATLADAGATVRTVPTVVAAAGLLGAAEAAGLGYDIVLFDARRAIDRELTVATLRDAAGQAIPAVVLIEPGQRRNIDLFRDEGFDAYLIRPVRQASLIRILGDLLEGRRGFHVDPADLLRSPSLNRPPNASLKVLIAEDDPIGAMLARAVLEKLGHEVTHAATAPLAVQAAGAAAFDIVLVDMRLAADSGLDVIRSLRRMIRGNVSIIAMSASDDMKTKLAAERAGADLYLEKPVSPEMLRGALQAVVGRCAA